METLSSNWPGRVRPASSPTRRQQLPGPRRPGRRQLRRFFQNDVRVGATRAEGTDAARRGAPGSVVPVLEVRRSRRTGSSRGPVSGFGFVKWSVGGMTLWWSESAILISPVTPAAASRWPTVRLEPNPVRKTAWPRYPGERPWSTRPLRSGRPKAWLCRALRRR